MSKRNTIGKRIVKGLRELNDEMKRDPNYLKRKIEENKARMRKHVKAEAVK